MVLHGWKEIATYLHCGVRTVQRWEALGMPVRRIRGRTRGSVMARTESLDAWVNRQSVKNSGKLRPDIEASLARAASIRARAMTELKVLLQTELRIGLALANRAVKNESKVERRNIAMARQAYDTIMRLKLRLKLERPSRQFEKDLDGLKGALRQLGEQV